MSRLRIPDPRAWLPAVWLGLALCGNPSWAAGPLTTGADFLLVTTGARPDALGQAFSAMADDINTLSFNPAGLGNIRLPEIGYGRYEFVADVHFDFIGLAVPVGRPGVVGLGYIGMGAPPFNSTLDPSAEKVSARETAWILAWGRSFERLHAGASVKYISRRIGIMSGEGVLADVGARYRFTQFITVAVSLMNFGPRVRLEEKEDTPAAVKVGSAWRILNHPLHTIDFAMDASVPWTSQKPRYGWGAEYWYHDMFAGRAGFIGNTVDEGLTAGCGVKARGFQIDYAYQPFNRLGVTHRISGLYRWRGDWLPGNEPNPPRFPKVTPSGDEAFLSWEKPIGPYAGFEVTEKPLGGDRKEIVTQTPDSPIKLNGKQKNVLYKITIRTVGKGGRKSYPSEPVYYEYSPKETPSPTPEPVLDAVETVTAPMETVTPVPSPPSNIRSMVDLVGLHLSWDPAVSDTLKGYNLYLKLPSGSVEKLSDEPKNTTDIWLAEPMAWAGGKWILTSVSSVGEEEVETVIGSYEWNPTRAEYDLLLTRPLLDLHVSPQASGRFFLDWVRDYDAADYSLFMANEDGIFEHCGTIDALKPGLLADSFRRYSFNERQKPWILIVAPRVEMEYRFIIVSRGSDGLMLKKTNIASGRISGPP